MEVKEGSYSSLATPTSLMIHPFLFLLRVDILFSAITRWLPQFLSFFQYIKVIFIFLQPQIICVFVQRLHKSTESHLPNSFGV